MRGFTKITTQAELDALFELLDGFHDAIVREAHLLNRSWVDPDSNVRPNEVFDLQVLVQSPSCPHDVEMVLSGVEACTFDVRDAFDFKLPCAVLETGTWPPLRIELGPFTGAELFYRTHPPVRRPGAVLGPEIPTSDSIPASSIQVGWRLCSGCAGAWEEDEERAYSRCPSCHVMTVLQRSD